MSCKSGKEECQARSVLQECQVRVFQKSVKQECQIRVSCKSVLPERSAIVSGKGVRQECHLSVSSQCVPQVGSLEIVTNKYYIFVSQHTCRHSGSWASSCFFFLNIHSVLTFAASYMFCVSCKGSMLYIQMCRKKLCLCTEKTEISMVKGHLHVTLRETLMPDRKETVPQAPSSHPGEFHIVPLYGSHMKSVGKST